jgi:hypothetical protein
MTPEEYRNRAPSGKPRKYQNKPTRVRGRTYDSKAEASRASILNALVRSGELRGVIAQPRVDLTPHHEEPTWYSPDFLVIDKDGLAWFEDVKGAEPERFKYIKKIWRDHGPAELRVIYKDHTDVVRLEER